MDGRDRLRPGPFIIVGFLLSGTGYAIIAGDSGTVAQIGQMIEVLGAATAAVAGGILALRRG